MRIKEFIIFLTVFTIIYVLFFIFFDAICDKKNRERENKRISSLFNGGKFSYFMKFYGIMDSTITSELLNTIYQDVKGLANIPLSVYSEKYHLSIYEFIVIILYFEYYVANSEPTTFPNYYSYQKQNYILDSLLIF